MADADSLVLFIRNTGALYPSLVASDRRLALKKVRGVYDRERAASEFAYIVEEGAKRYVKELGESEELPSVWHVAFPKAVRDRAAREMVDYFETHYGNNPEDFEKTLPKKYQGGKHAQAQLSEADMRARRKHGFTLAQLETIPVISEGHMDNLLIDTGKTRVWLARMTKEDGAKYDNAVTVEVRQPPGKSPEWKQLMIYPAKGRQLSQFLLPEVEAREADARARRMYPGKRLHVVASHHPGQYLLRSEDLTRTQLLKAVRAKGTGRAKRTGYTPTQAHSENMGLEAAAHSAAFVKRHESGGNPRTKLVHLRDIRLKSNAGMNFPLCKVTDGPLDTDQSALPTTGDFEKVTCSRCLALAPKRYGWAYAGKAAKRASASAARHESGGNPRTARYRGVEIEATSGGWYVAFIPDLGYLKSDTLAGARELVRNALAKPGAAKHESGNNPRTKKHPLDAAAVQRIKRAADRRHVAPSRSAKGSRKRAPFTGAQRKQRGLAPLDAGLKARVDALVGRGKK